MDLDVTELVVHIEQAVPLSLIANELILNSLKHGLRGGTGRIQVKLAYLSGSSHPEGQDAADRWAQIQIADSGPGLPAGLDVTNTHSLGLRLVNLLVRQLRGRFEVGAGPGASLSVNFPVTRTR